MNNEPSPTPKQTLFAALPPEWPATDLCAQIQKATRLARQRVIVLDDDPTGTQTVHNLPVLTHWTIDALAATALGVRRADVLGQILPGVPVWRLGQESGHPGLPYVVFPGNVGAPGDLAAVMDILSTA